MQHPAPPAASPPNATPNADAEPDAAPPPETSAVGSASAASAALAISERATDGELDASASRRTFLRGSLLGAGAFGLSSALSAPELAHAQTGALKSTVNHYHLPANDKTVHWGYFSRSLAPLIEVAPPSSVR